MKKAEQSSIIALPMALLTAAGLAWVGSQGGNMVYGVPLFAWCVGLAFAIQWIAFIFAFAKKTERFYDLVGSITFISVIGTALIYASALDARLILLATLIAIWAARLGIFLFRRIQAEGADRRFDEIKISFWRFLLAWSLQGLWVSFSLAAALAAMTSSVQLGLGVFAVLGTILWLLGFSMEVLADYQKKKFRKQPKNKGRFINVGLWSWSRHPNYFGEIVLWVGISLIAFPVLSGWQILTLISPVFVALLLTLVSGIPLLEKRADEKWGGQEDYEAYKAKTSVLIPMPPKALKEVSRFDSSPKS